MTCEELATQLASPAGAGLSGFSHASSYAATTVGAKLKQRVSPRDAPFGAAGDNVTDDHAALQAAIDHCVATGSILDLTGGAYVSGQQLVYTGACDTLCDATGRIRFTNPSSCGILLDLGHAALAEIRLPQLFSPAIAADYSIPGYSASGGPYDPNSRVGTAVHIKGGNRLHFHIHYVLGWAAGVRVEATPDAVSANIRISAGVIDFCTRGFSIAADQAGSNAVSEIEFHANTIWAKYPINLDPTNCIITGVSIDIAGGTYINERDGCTIYQDCVDASKMGNVLIRSPRNASGWGADSPAGTPTDLINPFLGGRASSNGHLSDGNATVGYWNANFCRFELGPIMNAVGGAGASGVPAAGNTIRIRDAGRNEVEMLFTRNVAVSAVATTTTAGEVNYNGGVGGAQYARQILCSAALPALPPLNGSALYYVYHQLISAGMTKQIRVTPFGSSLSDQGLVVWAMDDGAVENRRIKVQIVNPSSTRTAMAGIVYFWLEIG